MRLEFFEFFKRKAGIILGLEDKSKPILEKFN